MGYLLSFETVAKAVDDLRNNNKIIYTHGAYDLFHAGHLDFLKKSKECGQILIVGIETDELISKYKGVKRPVIRLKQRLEIISKLDYVDFTFPLPYLPGLFSNVSVDKPSQYHLNLYKELKPSLVTYGRKYSGKETIKKAKTSLKNVRFKRILDKYGGQFATTKIIDKILEAKIH